MYVLGCERGTSRGSRCPSACGRYHGESCRSTGSPLPVCPTVCTCSVYGSTSTTGGWLGSLSSPFCTCPPRSTNRLSRRSDEPNSVNCSLLRVLRSCIQTRLDHVSCLRSSETKYHVSPSTCVPPSGYDRLRMPTLMPSWAPCESASSTM